MFVTPARTGGICGWTPTDDHHDTLYTTIPMPANSSSSLTFPSASTPRAVRNPIPRSLSLDSNVFQRELSDDADPYDSCRSLSRYHNATSLRRYNAKRKKDPYWAPRPPNAFILFRRDYVEQHKGEISSSTETLSKRASNAWWALDSEGQKPWFEHAKKEAAEHLAQNPGYVFRPNKQSRSEARRHPSLPSRREKVEQLCIKSHRRRVAKSRSRSKAAAQYSTPGSTRSAASTEPPTTPTGQECPPLSQDVGSKPPPLQVAYPIPSPPAVNTGLLLSAAMASTPSLIPDQQSFIPKRSFSYTDGVDYRHSDFFYFDDSSFTDSTFTESDDQSIRSFESHTYESSSPTTFYTETSPEALSPCNELGAPFQMPEAVVMPSADSSSSSQPSASTSCIPPSTGPLFERRRRAATTSTLPSPLTVVTSSLAGRARDDLATARMVPRADTAPAPPSQPQSNMPVPQTNSYPHPEMTIDPTWDQPMQPVTSAAMTMLPAPIPEDELDRTPRAFAFAQNVQGTFEPTYDPVPNPFLIPMLDYPVQISERSPSVPQGLPYCVDPLDLTFNLDYESYQIGLRRHGISPSLDLYGTPPFDAAVDFGSYICPGDLCAQT